jgi:hypothetical protein
VACLFLSLFFSCSHTRGAGAAQRHLCVEWAAGSGTA